MSKTSSLLATWTELEEVESRVLSLERRNGLHARASILFKKSRRPTRNNIQEEVLKKIEDLKARVTILKSNMGISQPDANLGSVTFGTEWKK